MHTACLLENGDIYTFGCNDEGALGRDTSVEDSEYSPGKLQSDLKFIQISAGDSHTVSQTIYYSSVRECISQVNISIQVLCDND